MRPEKLLLALLVLLLAISGHVAADKTAAVHILKVAAPIGPGVAGFVADALDAADRENAACIVIQLDTPGGLAESMRQIIVKILAVRTPVIVFVAPSGARAASAGCHDHDGRRYRCYGAGNQHRSCSPGGRRRQRHR